MIKKASLCYCPFLRGLGLIISLLLSTPLHSQYFTGGLKLGISASQVDGDELGGYNKPGVCTGVFVNREINYYFKWQAELYYIMKGAAKITTINDPQMYRMSLHYIEMPFLGLYRISEKIEGQAGLALGYLWYATRNTGAGPEKLYYQIDKLDYSGILGLSYFINESFSLSLKLSHSLTTISREPGNITWWGTYGQYNHLLDLSMYYTFK